jgi:uncharacterized protein (TIGR02246 family)
MQRVLMAVWGFGALVLGSACTPQAEPGSLDTARAGPRTGGDTAAARVGMDSLRARFLAAYNRDDASAIAALYSEEALVVVDGDTIRGRSATEAGWRETLPVSSGMTLRPLARQASGDLAVEMTAFRHVLTVPGRPPVTDSGVVMGVALRQPDGSWRWQLEVLSRASDLEARLSGPARPR